MLRLISSETPCRQTLEKPYLIFPDNFRQAKDLQLGFFLLLLPGIAYLILYSGILYLFLVWSLVATLFLTMI